MKYGLTLARRYIGMLNGEITLEYRDGGITSLTVQFPFEKIASEGIISSSDDEENNGGSSLDDWDDDDWKSSTDDESSGR